MQILRVYVLPGIILVSFALGICMAANAILIPHGYIVTGIGASAPKIELVTNANGKVIGYRKARKDTFEIEFGPHSIMIPQGGGDGDEEEERPISYISAFWKASGVYLIVVVVASCLLYRLKPSN